MKNTIINVKTKNPIRGFNPQIPPVIKGDILKLGAISVGSNGDLMFKKDNYVLFLKNPEGKSVSLGQMIELKVVKIFPKVGYVEMIK